MTALRLVQAPLLSVDRGPRGAPLGDATGSINGWPLVMTVTTLEVHFALTRQDGPAFVINMNSLQHAAMAGIEAVLGLPEWDGK